MVNSCAGGLEFKSGPTKYYTELQMVQHCLSIYESSCVTLALYVAEMGTANSLHA